MNYGKNGTMKSIEDILPGEFFIKDKVVFIKTADYKETKNISRKFLCVSVLNGHMLWISGDNLVQIIDLYRRDSDGNILSIKKYDNNQD